jgi:surface antigen
VPVQGFEGGIADHLFLPSGLLERAALILSEAECMKAGMNRTAFFLLLASLVVAPFPVCAQTPLASRETTGLSEGDRLAAARAELEALDLDHPIDNFEWSGPDGTQGLLIVSSEFPSVYGMGGCRRLIHIIRHANDRGMNPTFDGVVCRDWEGKWSVRKP